MAECKREHCPLWHLGKNEEDCDDCVDGRFIGAVCEYASTCDGCDELTSHDQMTMDVETQLGYCEKCAKGMDLSKEGEKMSEKEITLSEDGSLIVPKLTAEDVDEIVENLTKIYEVREKPEPEFHCPICDSKTFKTETANNGIFGPAGRVWALYHHCDGCSVIFKDPEKFSAHTKSRS